MKYRCFIGFAILYCGKFCSKYLCDSLFKNNVQVSLHDEVILSRGVKLLLNQEYISQGHEIAFQAMQREQRLYA